MSMTMQKIRHMAEDTVRDIRGDWARLDNDTVGNDLISLIDALVEDRRPVPCEQAEAVKTSSESSYYLEGDIQVGERFKIDSSECVVWDVSKYKILIHDLDEAYSTQYMSLDEFRKRSRRIVAPAEVPYRLEGPIRVGDEFSLCGKRSILPYARVISASKDTIEVYFLPRGTCTLYTEKEFRSKFERYLILADQGSSSSLPELEVDKISRLLAGIHELRKAEERGLYDIGESLKVLRSKMKSDGGAK